MDIWVGLSLIGLCLGCARFVRLPIASAPFFVLSVCISLLYLFAYLGLLVIGTYLILIAGTFLLLAAAQYLPHQRTALTQQYLTPAFCLGVGFIFLLALMLIGTYFSAWDEFTQWGPHAKLLYFNQGFFTAADTTPHKDYPLGGALFYYLFFKVSGYSESRAYLGQMILIVAPLLLLFQNFSWSQWRRLILALVLILTCIWLLHVNVAISNSLYMDGVVGVFVGSALAMYFMNNRSVSSIIWLIPIVFAIMQLKSSLSVFCLLIAGIILLDQTISCLQTGIKQSWRTLSLAVLACGLLLFTAYFSGHSWQHYLTLIKVKPEWKLSIGLDDILRAFNQDTANSTQVLTIHNFWRAVIKKLPIIAVLITLIMFVIKGQQNKSDRVRLSLVHSAMLLGFAAYLFGLLVMYLFSFGAYEGSELASFTRYSSIYLVVWAIVIFANLILVYHDKAILQTLKLEKAAIPLLVIGLVSGLIVKHFIHERPNHQHFINLRQSIKTIVNKVNQSTPASAPIFVVWQNSKGLEHALLSYELLPHRTNDDCSSFGAKYIPGDMWTCHPTHKKFLKLPRRYHYILLAHVDQNFWQNYGRLLLQNPKALKPFLQYQVCKTKDLFNPISENKNPCQPAQETAYLFKIYRFNHLLFLSDMSEKLYK